MSDTTLFIAKPGILSAADKKELRKAGIICIEAANPDDFRFIRAEADMSCTDMLLAAMRAMNSTFGGVGVRAEFANQLSKLYEAAIDDKKKGQP